MNENYEILKAVGYSAKRHGNTPFLGKRKFISFCLCESEQTCIGSEAHWNNREAKDVIQFTYQWTKKSNMDELLANAEPGTQLDRLMKNAINHIPALTAAKEAIYGPSTVKKRAKPKTRYSRNIYHALDGGDTEDVKRHIKKLVALGTLSEPWPFHDQFTPLHVAARSKDVTHFRLMIEAGADHTVLDTSGRDAIAYGRSVKWWGETPEEHEARVNRLCAVVADHEASKLAASLTEQPALATTTTQRGRL